MQTNEQLQSLPRLLLPWYRENRRDLPWRQDRDPYHIWISEIMLQQTRVEAVKGYYRRFLQALPHVRALAEADDALLHKLWEGLGYYSRVRNLKKAAAVLVRDYNAAFPKEYDRLIKLPGIGPYTAGAISSIAFDQPVSAVDGNVLRLYCRLTADATPVSDPKLRERVSRELTAVYPAQAGDFTQALMELGATLCGPNRAPDCRACPCRSICAGHKKGIAHTLPVRLPKPQRRREEMTVLILQCGEQFALRRRPQEGLLAMLWEFPNVPGHLQLPQILAEVEQMGMKVTDISREVEKKHIFTHIQWQMHGVYLQVSHPGGDLSWLTRQQILEEAALPSAFRQFFPEEES